MQKKSAFTKVVGRHKEKLIEGDVKLKAGPGADAGGGRGSQHRDGAGSH